MSNRNAVVFRRDSHVETKRGFCRPATLLLTDDPIAATWFIIAATFSMFPLLLKDGLALPTYAMVTLFLTLSCTLLEWKLPRHGERVSKHGPHNEEEEQHQYDFACALVRFFLS